jgi:hypothetical protein
VLPVEDVTQSSPVDRRRFPRARTSALAKHLTFIKSDESARRAERSGGRHPTIFGMTAFVMSIFPVSGIKSGRKPDLPIGGTQ